MIPLFDLKMSKSSKMHLRGLVITATIWQTVWS